MFKNYKLQPKNLVSGFSLIEMLVVMFLFAILAFIVTQSTLQSFRGTRKVDASSKVRDNLDFAASLVERNIRNAKLITSPNPCVGASLGNISYTTQTGTTGSYTCSGGANQYLSDGTGARITSTDIVLTTCSFTCTLNGVYNPPIIDFVFAGKAANAAATDESFATISRRVILRVY